MSDDNNNKELANLEQRLNKLAGSGVKFNNITQVSPGQYQMNVHLDSRSVVSPLITASSDQIHRLVRAKKVASNSLLAKLHKKEEFQAIQKQLEYAGLKEVLNALKSGRNVEKTINDVSKFNREVGILDERFRDKLRPSVIDNRRGSGDTFEAMELYERTEEEYKRTGIYGTYLDLLSNFASTGFHNEHKDEDIKQYYDSWSNDVKFNELITNIFHNLFKYSVVYILPAIGTYEQHSEGISSIPGKEPKGGSERAKIIYSFNKFFRERGVELDRERLSEMLNDLPETAASLNSGTPVAYTIIDPKTVEVESSVFGGQTLTVKSSGLEKVSEAMDRAKEGKLSKEEKERIKLLPSKIRAAALEGEDYVDVDNLIQTIYLRKNDFETFALPKGTRVFDALDYKEELKKADFATLDGIFNYILKVTVGDKDNPVTDIDTLDSLAEAFNTPQKAFTVVWNHTLQIEKITTNEVGEILGNKKYEPVNEDITAGLGMTRALIDGTNVSAAAGVLSAKALQSEINAARKKVESWIYDQYKQIAMDAGFDTYPVVRWKQSVITTDSDAVTRASWMQLADRQLASRETAQLAVDLDPEAETGKLIKERDLLIKEGIGIMGSPFQQTSPSGDQGRPKGQPTGPKSQDTDLDTTRRSTPPSPSQQPTERSGLDLIKSLVNSLSEEDKKGLLKELSIGSIQEDIVDVSSVEVEE